MGRACGRNTARPGNPSVKCGRGVGLQLACFAQPAQAACSDRSADRQINSAPVAPALRCEGEAPMDRNSHRGEGWETWKVRRVALEKATSAELRSLQYHFADRIVDHPPG